MITITRQVVAVEQRINHTASLFGINFPMCFEPFVYSITTKIAAEYDGGYWEFYELSNGGFYMAPDPDQQFHVVCENGFDGRLSGDALGVAVCLYAYSNLSFGDANEFAETCASQYHLLRDYMLEHKEVSTILGAID